MGHLFEHKENHNKVEIVQIKHSTLSQVQSKWNL